MGVAAVGRGRRGLEVRSLRVAESKGRQNEYHKYKFQIMKPKKGKFNS
jgi:hypothetical protein